MDVLIIEPDHHLAISYQQALEAEGIAAAIAYDGQEAITAIDEGKPRLVCLELHLPRHNGVEFIYELRSYPEWDDIPIVLLTFVSEPDLGFSRGIQEQLGIQHYFYKPRTELRQFTDYIKRQVT